MLNNWKENFSKEDYEELIKFIELSQKSIPLHSKFLIICGNDNIKKFQLCEDIKETMEGDLGYLTIDRKNSMNDLLVISQNIIKKISVYNSENYNNFIPNSIIKTILYREKMQYRALYVDKQIVPVCNIIMTVNSVDSLEPAILSRAIVIHLSKKRKCEDSP
jgi:hypothetical protein